MNTESAHHVPVLLPQACIATRVLAMTAVLAACFIRASSAEAIPPLCGRTDSNQDARC